MAKDKAAVALGRKRWAQTSTAERRAAMDALRAQQTMTPEQRSERARKAAAASAKVRAKKAAKKKVSARKPKAGNSLRAVAKKSLKN